MIWNFIANCRIVTGRFQSYAVHCRNPENSSAQESQGAWAEKDFSMLVSLGEFEQGLREYWSEIDRRARHVQAREQAFDDLAAAYAGKTPPHFNRAELTQIMEWKHTDARWFNRAMQGINAVSDAKIAQITSNISADPRLAIQGFNGAFHGVGVASASAILTGARPDLYAVIDVFALIAIDHHYTFSWIDRM